MKLKYNFVILLSLLFTFSLAFNVEAKTGYVITSGETLNLEIEAGVSTFVTFTPEVSGKYSFTSVSECDTLAALYDENMNELIFNDDSGETSNFYISYNFEKGKKYIFSVYYYGEKIDYDMVVTLNIITPCESHIHDYKETVIKEPTCEAEGENRFFCICGNNYTVNISKLSHSYKTVHKANPDCTKSDTNIEECQVCGYINETKIEALGHDFSATFTIDTAPTCTAKGSASRHCSRCNKKTEVVSIDKTGHIASDKYVVTKEATCTAVGKKVKRCAVCNTTIETVSISKNGHTAVNEYITAKEPTCTAKGEKIKRCVVCETVVIRTGIEKLGHSYSSSYTTDKKSSLKESGERSRHCKRCGARTSVTLIPKIKTVKLSKTVYTYNGKYKTPEVIVKNSKGESLKNKTDYSVTYKKAKNIGKHTVTVTFKGNYSGKITLDYSVIPQNVKSVSATQTKNTVTLTWNKINGGVKYRIYIKNNKTGKFIIVKDTEKTSVKIKGLKSGTDYTFSVKAIKKVSGKIYKSEKGTHVSVATIPAKVSLKAVSNKSRSVILSWSETACDGYVIYKYNAETKTYEPFKIIKDSDVTVYERENMAKGKTYLFKIRSYKGNGNGRVYSSFSDAVKIQVK